MKDLNKLLAEWLGWELKESNRPVNRTGFDPPEYYYATPDGAMWVNLEFPANAHWNPTQSHDQIHRYLLPKVAELGLCDKVTDALAPHPAILGYTTANLWKVLTASPETLCQAIAQAAGLMKEGV